MTVEVLIESLGNYLEKSREGDMSRAARIKAWKESQYSTVVYDHLALLATGDNKVGISQHQLCSLINCSRPSISKAVAVLQKYNLIAYKAIKGGTGSYFMLNPHEFSTVHRDRLVKSDSGVKRKEASPRYLRMCSEYKELRQAYLDSLDEKKREEVNEVNKSLVELKNSLISSTHTITSMK